MDLVIVMLILWLSMIILCLGSFLMSMGKPIKR